LNTEASHVDIARQLLIGSGVIALNVMIQAELFSIYSRRFEGVLLWGRPLFRRFTNTAMTVLSILFILSVITLEVWIWSGVLLAVGAVHALEPALYFALVCFSTLGLGDITLSHDWRLMSAMISANGFLMFGWATAYIVDLIRLTR
jgi:hypothetical protein